MRFRGGRSTTSIFVFDTDFSRKGPGPPQVHSKKELERDIAKSMRLTEERECTREYEAMESSLPAPTVCVPYCRDRRHGARRYGLVKQVIGLRTNSCRSGQLLAPERHSGVSRTPRVLHRPQLER